MTALLVLIGVLGLVVGSFLNVVIHRVPRRESVLRPGSHCARCLAAIMRRHNVPVLGWLLLGGRCGHCRERISPRYPLVEVGTALLFVAVAARFGPTPALPAYLYLAAIAIALATIDLEARRLPDAIVLPSYLVGALLLIAAGTANENWSSGGRALLAMATLAACYVVVALLYPDGIGLGDVKLAGLLGLFLGWLSWSAVWIGALTGLLVGGLVATALLATGRASRQAAIPFGPAMLAGAMLAVFIAGPVANWCRDLISPTA
jgi:leader peptidase (prepilin peptidase)/N-methyltransferase